MKQVLFLFSLSLLFACNSSAQKETGTTPNQTISEVLSPAEFAKKMMEFDEYNFVDVRTTGEVAGGKIEGAAHIDFYQSDFETQINNLDKTKPLFIYCASGKRSATASNICKNLGFSEIYDLQGGYNAWKSSGK